MYIYSKITVAFVYRTLLIHKIFSSLLIFLNIQIYIYTHTCVCIIKNKNMTCSNNYYFYFDCDHHPIFVIVVPWVKRVAEC